MGGALVVRSPSLFEQLYFLQNATGAVLSPWDCFLVTRGVKTLPLRVHEQSRSAMRVAEFLHQHPLVQRVLYPGLPDHPGHALRGAKCKAASAAC